MAKGFSRSGNEQSFVGVYEYWQDARDGLRLLVDHKNSRNRFLGMTPEEVQGFLIERQQELDYQSSLALLGSIEAILQLDFHCLVQNKLKDPLSREFRKLKKSIQRRISLEEHILKAWQTIYPETRPLFQPLSKAIKFRHWLAHGRYWLHRSEKFNFYELYEIAELMQNSLPLKS